MRNNDASESIPGEITVRAMEDMDRGALAELICLSTNHWYQTHGMAPIFAGGPAEADVFYEVYSAMEGSAGFVAATDIQVVGSCFYHVRPTHVSLGIMNVHPNYFGRGVARRLLARIISLAEGMAKPLRLVSSAMNTDSFSLYTRAGFVPFCVYQDISLAVPACGLGRTSPLAARVRPATIADVPMMAAVELQVSGIRRDGDYRHFIRNLEGCWHVSVCTDGEEGLEGFLVSGPGMLGPGVARSEAGAEALLLAELERWRGRTPVFLLPVSCGELVQRAYAWGGRNRELHFAQARGLCPPLQGVTLPTFLPETG